MQHPDEGTIHAWLDGALSAGEASALEAHVAGCDQCAAAVTEARGLLAASSRILSALDSVPGGVLPATAPRAEIDDRVIPIARPSRWRSPGWRAAAAIVLVGSVSWLATRSTPREVDGNVAAPTEASKVATSAGASQQSMPFAADSTAQIEQQSARPSAPQAVRRTVMRDERAAAEREPTAPANKLAVPPAPSPQANVATTSAMPYAAPRLVEPPNVGTGGGIGATAGRVAAEARMAAPAPAPVAVASADAALRADTSISAPDRAERRMAPASSRMKVSAERAAPRRMALMETTPDADTTAQRLAGCYYLETASSRSSRPAIRSAAALVPAQIELALDFDSSSHAGWRILRPAPGSPQFATGAHATWSAFAADSVQLELGRGSERVTARLEIRGDSIHGNATVIMPQLDAGSMGTGVRGTRMLCSSP